MTSLYADLNNAHAFPLFAASLGGLRSLNETDIAQLRAGVRRVYDLMKSGNWCEAHSIRMAAGSNGIPASEGLRRMRELRRWGYDIERERVEGSRNYRYRLTNAVAGDDLYRRLP